MFSERRLLCAEKIREAIRDWFSDVGHNSGVRILENNTELVDAVIAPIIDRYESGADMHCTGEVIYAS